VHPCARNKSEKNIYRRARRERGGEGVGGGREEKGKTRSGTHSRMRFLDCAGVAVTPGTILRPVADHGGASVRISRRGAFLANPLPLLRVPAPTVSLSLFLRPRSLLQERRISSTFSVIAERIERLYQLHRQLDIRASYRSWSPSRVPTRGCFERDWGQQFREMFAGLWLPLTVNSELEEGFASDEDARRP